MNGVHDMGGMHGFGPVPVDADEPFHDDTDRTIFAMHMMAIEQGIYNLDELRFARERMGNEAYLAATYWERDLVGLEDLLVEGGYVTEEELEEWKAEFDGDVPEVEDPELERRAREFFEADRFDETEEVEPAFEPGDRVVARNMHPEGHTRTPRYVRGVEGEVRKVYGTFDLPDSVVEGDPEPEPCYSVCFDAADLWGEDTSADTHCIDMWESYLRDGRGRR